MPIIILKLRGAARIRCVSREFGGTSIDEEAEMILGFQEAYFRLMFERSIDTTGNLCKAAKGKQGVLVKDPLSLSYWWRKARKSFSVVIYEVGSKGRSLSLEISKSRLDPGCSKTSAVV